MTIKPAKCHAYPTLFGGHGEEPMEDINLRDIEDVSHFLNWLKACLEDWDETAAVVIRATKLDENKGLEVNEYDLPPIVE